MPHSILLPDTVTLDRPIARPPQELAKPETAKDNFEVSPTGLLVPKAQGITSPTQPKILLPTREQITTLTAQPTAEANEAEKPEGNLAAFLYDPMAYLARKVMSEEHMGEQNSEVVTDILLRMSLCYETRAEQQYGDAAVRLNGNLGHVKGYQADVLRLQELENAREAHERMAEKLQGTLAQSKQTPELHEVLSRKTTQLAYYDKNRKEQSTREVSSPSVMEQVAVAILEELNTPNIRKSYPEVQEVLEVLKETIKSFRGALEVEIMDSEENHELIKPEMPTVVRLCTNMLEANATSPAIRSSIYNTLEQLNIPREYSETVLLHMDTNHDLEHPLALQLSLDAAKHNPNSAFLLEQETRREELLKKLHGSAQMCFDNYQLLMSQAQGLVCAANLRHPSAGRIGLEFEFNSDKEFDDTEYASTVQVRFNSFLKGFEIGSNFTSDPPGFEARKNLNALEHTQDHIEDTITLRRALLDLPDFAHLSSLHIHLDRERHPFKATMGNYFSENGYREVSRSNFKKDEENRKRTTFEIRGLVVPMDSEKGINAARVDDATEMLIGMAAVTPKPRGKIQLPEGTISDWKQVVFGHVCNLYVSPEIRLACLMCLQDDQMLRGGMIEGLLNTYNLDLLDKLDPKAFPGRNRELGPLKGSLTTTTGSREFGAVHIADTLSQNLDNEELVTRYLEKCMSQIPWRDPLSDECFAIIKNNPALSQQYLFSVISRVKQSETIVNPTYLAEGLEILERDQVTLGLTNENLINTAVTFLTNMSINPSQLLPYGYKNDIPRMLEICQRFIGETMSPEVNMQVKGIFLRMAKDSRFSASRDIFTEEYIAFLEHNQITFTDAEIRIAVGGNARDYSSTIVMNYFYENVMDNPEQHPDLVEQYMNKLMFMGSCVVSYGDSDIFPKTQKEAYGKIVDKLLDAAEEQPDRYADIARAFYRDVHKKSLTDEQMNRLSQLGEANLV